MDPDSYISERRADPRGAIDPGVFSVSEPSSPSSVDTTEMCDGRRMFGGADSSGLQAEVAAVEVDETGGVETDPSVIWVATEAVSMSDCVLLSHDSTVDADRESSWSSTDCSLETARDLEISSAAVCSPSLFSTVSWAVSCLLCWSRGVDAALVSPCFSVGHIPWQLRIL